jgi:hypothetical protein
MPWLLLQLIACDGLTCGTGAGGGHGICLGGSEPLDDRIQVYVLAGQSNMDGSSPVSGLPPSLRVPQEDVRLYWSEVGELTALMPAAHRGARYTGPEVTFGRTLADAGREVVIVKHAVSGTTLAEYWAPGGRDRTPGEGWLALTEAMANVGRELDDAGEPWRWAGLAWMQGEADASYEAMASDYADNLTGFVEALREETDTPELPVAIGLIAPDVWTYGDTVRAAQRQVASSDRHATLVETADLPLLSYDRAHYDGPSMRVLGERFARSFLGEAQPAPASPALTVTGWSEQGSISGTAGWRFRTDVPLIVTDVGTFGSGQPEFQEDWGLWDAVTGETVASGRAPTWAEAPTSLRDGFWYAAVDPIELPPGDYVLGLARVSQGSIEVAVAEAPSFAKGLSFVEGRTGDGDGLVWPDGTIDGGSPGLFGPTFLFQEP